MIAYRPALRLGFILTAVFLTAVFTLAGGEQATSSGAGGFLRIIYSGGLNGELEPCG